MRVLHICNDFSYSKVHANLYLELDSLGIEQTVFTFYGVDDDRMGRNCFDGTGTRFIYKGIIKPYHRVLYHNKIKTVYNELLASIKPRNYDLTHAISVFTNGPIAYKLWKQYGIPYVVAVRNTDINAFMNVAPHTWRMGLKVLLHAERIIFISKALKELFCRHFLIRLILEKIKDKFILQPNGIDDYWINHVYKGERNNNHRLIYVGRFDTNKNVERLLKAVLSLRKKYEDIHIDLVGGGDTRHEKVMKLVVKYPDVIHYHGKIHDVEKLSELYHECSLFAMPSFYETFGLVYLEALTQGLVVLYTRHQGIDGLLDKRVGESVNAFSQKSIEHAICRVFDNRDKYLSFEVVDFDDYRWDKIAKRYIALFNDVIANKGRYE